MDQSIMRADNPPKVMWLYEDDHLKQPFICLAKESLTARGYSVTILDSASHTSSGELPRATGDGRTIPASDGTAGGKLTARLIWRLRRCFRKGWLRSVPGARYAEKLLL